jgi:hypothetical protein
MHRLALLLVPVFLLACGEEPVAPDAEVAPSLAASSAWTESSFVLDFVYLNGVNTCVGEPWHGYGEVPYKMHEVSNGAGGYSYFYQFLPTTPWGPQYSLTGVWSGTVWWYQNGLPYNESFHVGLGEVYRLKWVEMYQSDDGQRLYNDGWLQLTTNANGELVVDRYENLFVRCEPGKN